MCTDIASTIDTMLTFYVLSGEPLLGRYVAHLLSLAKMAQVALKEARLVILVEPSLISQAELQRVEKIRHPKSRVVSIGSQPSFVGIEGPHFFCPFTPQDFYAFIEENVHRIFPLSTQARQNPFLGEDPKIERLREFICTLAVLPEPILLEGEVGTGKELFARHICACFEGEFLKFTPGPLPREMIEPLLFGFCGGMIKRVRKPKEGILSKARDGVLYIEGLEDLPLKAQQKLLYFLETGTFVPLGSKEFLAANPKLVVSLKRSPGELIREGKLLDQLYFRLARFRVSFPNLRKRLIDLPLLVEHFVQTFAARYRRPLPMLKEELFRHLLLYSWPRNIEELAHSIQDLVLWGEDRFYDRFEKKVKVPKSIKEVEEALAQLFRRSFRLQIESSRTGRVGHHTESR